MRDFYDIYLIYVKEGENINKAFFRKAVEKTFKKRDFTGNFLERYKIIKESDILRKRWGIYSKKYDYAENIEYEELLYCIEKLMDLLL